MNLHAAALLPRRLLMAAVRGYRYALSPWLGNACRFDPTCSVYALTALERHGAVVGTGLTVGRLLRCQPFCRAGHDPVPQTMSGFFTRWLSTDDSATPALSAGDDASAVRTDPLSGTALHGRLASSTSPEKTVS